MKLPVVESPEKQTNDSSPPPSPPSFFLLPDEITVNYLARIPRSYYPTISTVSKSFNSFLSSNELYIARSRLGFTEQCLYVCFIDTNHMFLQWFRLWVNPNRTLASSSVIGRLVPIPPCNFLTQGISTLVVGSEIYFIGGPINGPSSSAVWVLDCLTNTWRDAPSMNVARKNASSCLYDGEIYVLGGYKGLEKDESWAEVFDTKTQTWERLPNPSTDIHRSCINRNAEMEGNLYVLCANNMYTYGLKQGNWELCEGHMSAMILRSECVIENASYMCFSSPLNLSLYDINDGILKEVKGLESLEDKYRTSACSGVSMTRLVSCGGKILLFWAEHLPRRKMVWCAEIAVEKRDGGEVWGRVEWANVVCTVPDTCHLLQCLVVSI